MHIIAECATNQSRDAEAYGERDRAHVENLTSSEVINTAEEGVVGQHRCEDCKAGHEASMTEMALHDDSFLVVRLSPTLLFLPPGPPQELSHHFHSLLLARNFTHEPLTNVDRVFLSELEY